MKRFRNSVLLIFLLWQSLVQISICHSIISPVGISKVVFAITLISQHGQSVLVDVDADVDRQIDIDKCCPEGSVVELSHDFKGDWAFCTETGVGAGTGTGIASVSLGEHGKVKMHDDWSPYFYREIKGLFTSYFEPTSTLIRGGNGQVIRLQPKMIITQMNCKPFRILTTYPGAPEANFAQFRMVDTGDILWRQSGNQRWTKMMKNDENDLVQNYCIDGLIVSQSDDANVPSNNTYTPSEDSQVILMCMDTEQLAKAATMRGTINMLNFCLVTFVSIFPAAIVIVYILIWDQLNVHGWTKGTLSFCILFYALLLIVKIGDVISTGRSLIPLESPACVILGVLIHFFNIAIIAWQSVLNYDIWATITAKTWKPDGSKGKRRFAAYCGFGFGIPTLVVGVSLVMDHTFGVFDDRVVRPQYGKLACAADPVAYLYYVLIIRKILFVFNIVFAFLVLRFMYRYKKEQAFLKRSHFEVRSNRCSWNHGCLFVKLFALMGLSLLAELIQFFINRENHPSWYWAVLGIYTSIQPVFFFWIFVCNKEVKKKLCFKYQLFQDFFDWIDEMRIDSKASADISSLTVEPSSPTRKNQATTDSL